MQKKNNLVLIPEHKQNLKGTRLKEQEKEQQVKVMEEELEEHQKKEKQVR